MLRTHIAWYKDTFHCHTAIVYSFLLRHDDHFQAYKERCGKLKISMHERAIPKHCGIYRRCAHLTDHDAALFNHDNYIVSLKQCLTVLFPPNLTSHNSLQLVFLTTLLSWLSVKMK